MPTITLLTDFGTSDTYVGQMKGVIASIAPDTPVIDLTHEVPPQDVLAGAIELDGAVDAFPEGTIHVGVVDPGVGSHRRPIAMQTDRFTFVGPDNGLFTAVAQRSDRCQAVALTECAYFRSRISATFHGRDVFAPAAAHLATGVALNKLGGPIPCPHRLELPQPTMSGDTLHGRVLLIDHFGNLITNITSRELQSHAVADGDAMRTTVGEARIDGLSQTFSDVAEGEPVAYLGSGGRLEIAIRNGDAARSLSVRRGEPVTIAARP